MVEDLCIIMLTAGIASLIFKLAKQPVVLGYIVAGMMVGPHMLGESWITDEESVDTWGNIGVLFLLFSLGLEFSIKKLIKVGSTAVVGALTIVAGMMLMGYCAGILLGWNSINSLFLGGMLCMSSTTIVFKAIEDGGLRNHRFARVAFGILIVEDLFAVVLMVLLTSIAVKNSLEGKELLMQIGKLVGYLAIWFVGGIAIIPSFLSTFRKYLNDETLTIIAIGLCLGMVLLAVEAGFSPALGAFVMGSILAETIDAERIEHLVQPMKNIFGSIFFVSVGMMIAPTLLVKYWLPIIIISLIVICGQIVFGTLGTLLAGQPLRVCLQTGFSLVQIGEFAFIIASLGQQLGVTDRNLYPIVVAVSVLTTFLTPYIMRLAYPTLNFLNSHLSEEVKERLDSYVALRNIPNSKSSSHTKMGKIAEGALFAISFIPGFKKFYSHFENNLYAREKSAESKRSLRKEVEQVLLSCDLLIGEADVPANSKFNGKTLSELNVRRTSGVSIVSIVRGGIYINIPGGDDRIYTGDRIVVAGTDEQIGNFNRSINEVGTGSDFYEPEKHQISLHNYEVKPGNKYVGMTIQDTHLREKASCIVIGIIDDQKGLIMNPDPMTIIEENALLIIAGEKDNISIENTDRIL